MVEGQSWKGFTFRGYQDRYWFSVARPAAVVREIVVRFYQSRKGRLAEDSERLVFSRGRRSWSYGGDDTAPEQDIVVTLATEDGPATKLSILYDVRGCFLRLPPYGLRNEVEQLETAIQETEPNQITGANHGQR